MNGLRRFRDHARGGTAGLHYKAAISAFVWTIRRAGGIRAGTISRTGRALMKLFLLKFFTWWSGQTFGTQLWTWRFGELVGQDEQGNRYYLSLIHI